jgi:hypothetical protein
MSEFGATVGIGNDLDTNTLIDHFVSFATHQALIIMVHDLAIGNGSRSWLDAGVHSKDFVGFVIDPGTVTGASFATVHPSVLRRIRRVAILNWHTLGDGSIACHCGFIPRLASQTFGTVMCYRVSFKLNGIQMTTFNVGVFMDSVETLDSWHVGLQRNTASSG